MPPVAPFPLARPRRLRRTPWIRDLVTEHLLGSTGRCVRTRPRAALPTLWAAGETRGTKSRVTPQVIVPAALNIASSETIGSWPPVANSTGCHGVPVRLR